MKRVLQRMLDPEEFLSPYGIRSVSRYHAANPFRLHVGDDVHMVGYEPAESQSGLFGGNSNWRGPVWFPPNFLLIEALREFHRYYGDDFLIEHPTGSGVQMPLSAVADDLSDRLIALFRRDAAGRRPCFGESDLMQNDLLWRDRLLFHEYFHGDTGEGLGASHQTGWTALVAPLIEQRATGVTKASKG